MEGHTGEGCSPNPFKDVIPRDASKPPAVNPSPASLAGPAPGHSRTLSRNAKNQSPSVSIVTPFSASAISPNGATSEVAEAPEVAEAGPEAAERVRKLPKQSSG